MQKRSYKHSKPRALSSAATLSQARSVLKSEAQALLSLAPKINQNFYFAVKRISQLPAEGRLILSGVGKASFIAMKLSATFASIGTPSFFLHPAEALHGDLGRYTPKDISLVLSNSGETPEIVSLLPHLKRIGCPIIALCAHEKSSLARHSDIVLSLGQVIEAGPLGLAPTTSTTVMLALGDALAMTVLSHKGSSPRDFARFHPGGFLGKSLITVAEVMRSGKKLCIVQEETKNRELLHCISRTPGRPGAAAIVNKRGILKGIFTDGDLRRCLDQRSDFLSLSVSTVMGKSPKVITAEKLAQEALRRMSEHQIDQLVVVDKAGRPIGMIDIQDLV